LINFKGNQLILYQNNLLKFVNPTQIISNENLFKLELKYKISSASA